MRSLKDLRVGDVFRFLRYIFNPFRLVKWFFYFLFFSVILSLMTLTLVDSAHAAESTPAKKVEGGSCWSSTGVPLGSASTIKDCVAAMMASDWGKSKFTGEYGTGNGTSAYIYIHFRLKNSPCWESNVIKFTYVPAKDSYVCPPDGKPDFSVGPVLTGDGNVCQKKPLTCLTGSILETNVITGKQFCRPYCHGVAGNTLGAPGALVTYFAGTIGSTTISCYGQCSVVSQGVSVNSTQNPNVYNGIIKFTGANCPLQVNGEDGNETVSGNSDQANSSQGTNNAQNDLNNATNNAINNPTSGATGTANLNTVVDKLAETSNAEIKASSEQNAALGKVVENVGKDIQQAIKDAQAVGGSGASIGHMQTANAIKEGNQAIADGNAQLGGKLDAIKDAIEKQDDTNEPFPQVPTKIDADPATINPNPNNWAEHNYATVLQNHAKKLQELPLYSGISGFFNVNINGGKCPEFTADIPSVSMPVVGTFGGGKVEYSFCETSMDLVLNIIKSVVMVLSTFFAVRYALE
ncbi:hypothetical protein ODY53_10265 [Aeromonas veronii]|uniref:hypothetical protein n=1 Tax=Aeromonas veronii TaxID=654 RepID=UPI0022452F18|nr:hypothetical protein [Aeromonas veronii]MCX0422758.1 hypothetical protein [Aeromonas veronii]